MVEKQAEITIEEAAKRARGAVFKRLRRRWTEIEPVRNELMAAAKKAGMDKAEAQVWTYTELDRLYPPVPLPEKPKPEPKQKPEPKPEPRPEPSFYGYLGDVDELIDPDYTEPDAGNRLRDAYVWVGDEFRRITEDRPDNSTLPPGTITTMRFERAHTRPPTPLAVQIAEYYGEYRAKRSELLNRLASFAAKAHDTKDQQPETTEAGYLDSLG